MTEKEFINQHRLRVLAKDHPCADSFGNVFKHRLEAEEDIGRYLLPIEQVHHHYFSKGGYILAVCKNQREHKQMHAKEEAFRYSGHYDWEKCSFCKEYDDPENMSITKWHKYHKSCAAKSRRLA